MGLNFCRTNLLRIADSHYIAVFKFADDGSFILYFIYRLCIYTNRTIRISRIVLTVNIVLKR